MENKRKRFSSAVAFLSQDIQSVLQKAPLSICEKAQEITIRVNKPICVECENKRYYFTHSGCVTDTILQNQMVIANPRSVFETFQNICNYSVYSRQNEINNGYITLKGGHRAGICGTAVNSDNKIINIKDISTINIRIAREIVGCADELYDRVDPLCGVLICGAPCSGKTTLLRDFARRLSYDYKVSVIDERNELSSTVNGITQNDMGMCDIYDSYVKEDAITHAVRSMSPDIIVCDEISTLRDVKTLTRCVNSGVAFVATIHANDSDSMLRRQSVKEILSTQAFSSLVFLDSRNNAGKIRSIISVDEIYGDCDA